MKKIAIYIITVCFLFGWYMMASANDANKKTGDQTGMESPAASARSAKGGAVKGYQESKEAIIRDVKGMKEEIPRGLQEAKESAIQQSREFRESATKEFKEIKDNLSNPIYKPKSENK